MKKIILLTNTIFITCISAFSQINGNFANFFNNETYLNPAFAGTAESGFNLSNVARNEYLGYGLNKYALRKNLLTIDKRFDEKNFGLSFNLNGFTYNYFNNYELSGNYSYHLNIGHDRKLCMGLKAGVLYNTFVIEPDLQHDNDPSFVSSSNFKNSANLKIGTGFVYKDQKSYAGIAVPDITNKLTMVASGGYKFQINDELFLQPNFLFRYVNSYQAKKDLNVLIGKQESFWAGATYSLGNSIAVMGGIYINGRLKLGYAFDYNTVIQNYGGSHEILLQWDLEDAL